MPLSTLQIIMAVGVAMQLVYLAYFDLWAVFVPLAGELIFVSYLFAFKVFIDFFSHEGPKAVRNEPTTTAGTGGAGRNVAEEEANALDSHSRLEATSSETT